MDTCSDIKEALIMEGQLFLGCDLCSNNLCNSSDFIKNNVISLIINVWLIKLFIY